LYTWQRDLSRVLQTARHRTRLQSPAENFLRDSQAFIEEASANSLPRLAAPAGVSYAVIAGLLQSSHSGVEDREWVTERVDAARKLLAEARLMFDSSFAGADEMRTEIEVAEKRLQTEWYETVTPEEIASIKRAMVSGPRGIVTHSGHWYKCRNGHTVRHSTRRDRVVALC
jgi:hypothetical protein